MWNNNSVFLFRNLAVKLQFVKSVCSDIKNLFPSAVTGMAATLQVEPTKRPQFITPANADYSAKLLPPNFHKHPYFMKQLPEPFNPIPCTPSQD